VKWVTITPDWAAFPSLRRFYWSVPASDGDPDPREADMRHTTISGHHGTHQRSPLMKTIKQLLNMEIYQNVAQQK
jgi:hypothetical protein